MLRESAPSGILIHGVRASADNALVVKVCNHTGISYLPALSIDARLITFE